MKLGAYRYHVKSTGASSQKFGPCEVCDRPVGEVFIQREEQECTITAEDYIDGRDALTGEVPVDDIFWAHEGYTFGHESCLLQARK